MFFLIYLLIYLTVLKVFSFIFLIILWGRTLLPPNIEKIDQYHILIWCVMSHYNVKLWSCSILGLCGVKIVQLVSMKPPGALQLIIEKCGCLQRVRLVLPPVQSHVLFKSVSVYAHVQLYHPPCPLTAGSHHISTQAWLNQVVKNVPSSNNPTLLLYSQY